jgi:CheY-like chemotaxis protein
MNLIGNALKFTSRGGVTVTLVRNDLTGRPVRIDIADTGIGIPADRLVAVFGAFQQADSSTARQFGGTGLGLTITKSLAELMGFAVVVTSELGKGSTFSIDLAPRSAPRLVFDRRVAAAPARGTRRWLALVIDDDADARTVLTEQFEDLDCDVVTAASADEGLVLARQVRPDLITIDVMMPGKNGIEALHEFKTDPVVRDIPVVVVSVVADDHKGKVLGAVDCLPKPVTREALASMLDRTVATRPHLVLRRGS